MDGKLDAAQMEQAVSSDEQSVGDSVMSERQNRIMIRGQDHRGKQNVS